MEGLEYYIGSIHWLDAITPPLEQHLRELASQVQLFLASTGSWVAGPLSTLVAYDPTGFQRSTAALSPASTYPGIIAGPVFQVAFGPWENTDVLPVGHVSISPQINLEQHLAFTFAPDEGATFHLDSLTYDKRSYFGFGPRKASVRSSLNSFERDIDTVVVNSAGFESLSFCLRSLPPIGARSSSGFTFTLRQDRTSRTSSARIARATACGSSVRSWFDPHPNHPRRGGADRIVDAADIHPEMTDVPFFGPVQQAKR